MYFFLNLGFIDINFILHAVKLIVPASGNVFFLHYTVYCILSQLFVGGTVFEIAIKCSSHASFEVLQVVVKEVEPITFEGLLVELKDCILETACTKSNHWSATAEEFVLDDASWFKHGGHDCEITADVDEGSVGEELVWVAPEAMRVLVCEVFHFLRTVFSILFSGIRHSSDQDLNVVAIFKEKTLSCVKNEVDSFLSGHSTDEGQKRDIVFELSTLEVLLLEESF